MTIERIHQAVRLDFGSRFLILFGEGIEDTFISANLDLINIEAALLATLKAQGIERVAFLSPHQPVYFLDAESQTLSTPAGIYQQAGAASGQMRILRDGPLSNRFLLPVNTQPVDALPGGGMGDVHALRWLDTIMRDEYGPRSAVVFMQAESTLQFFEDPRTLTGLIGNWARLPARNSNICILLFSAANANRLTEIAPTLPVPELRDAVLDPSRTNGKVTALQQIGMPQATEIQRLLHHLEEQEVLKLGEDAASLAQWLSSEGISIHQWIARLASIAHLDRSVARRLGWISAVNDPLCSAEERLSSLVGLHRVKQHLSEMSAWLFLQLQREPSSDFPLLHMVFSGNPGTGKTTVARLIGELYRNMGVLKRGHLVEARAADLVANHVGGTSGRTDQVIDQALDGVLFLDEAYILTEPDRGGFGQEAVDTLISRMENDRDRLVVIVAGYPEKMQHFLQSNPGLARRFPIENHYDFPDFQPDELAQILLKMLSNRSIPIEEGMTKRLMEIVNGLYHVRDETFGNAGEVRNLCDAIDRRRAARVMRDNLPINSPLELDDLPEKYRDFLVPAADNVNQLFQNLDELVGLQSVKGTIRRMVHRLELEQLRRQFVPGKGNVTPIQHLIFTGNPGTGKTTVARLVGRLYKSLGLLKKGHVVEVSRHDLVAGYVGQTALKTMDRVKAALDGVLFIDEAYSLMSGGPNDFGQEAIDTLVKAMEDYRERIVFIVAGYPQEMRDFLNTNPGLTSRFSSPISFPDYSQDEMGKILQQLATRDGYVLPQEVCESVLIQLDLLRSAEKRSFGNARTIQAIFECMKDSLAERVLSDKNAICSADVLSTFLVSDVPVPTDISTVTGLLYDSEPAVFKYQLLDRANQHSRLPYA
jgi:SpoVK/Ycf46/Vps4 family AAA+-type ATPase